MATSSYSTFRRLGALIALCSLALPAFGFQTRNPIRYRVVEIGALGGVMSTANCVNDADTVVGNVKYADGHLQAFIWDERNGIRRVQPGVRESTATCINRHGEIAGAIRDSNDNLNAVVWSPSLSATFVAEAPFGAEATSINDSGQVVGFREDGIFDVVDQAFLWPAIDANSAWTPLFDLNSDSFATAINDSGAVAGSVDRQAFLRTPDGTIHLLAGDPNFGPPAVAVAINDKGDVAVSQLGIGLLFHDHLITRLTSFGPIFPLALNRADVVVGYVEGSSRRAFIWSQANGFSFLDSLLDTSGWRIVSANSINRRGDIAGMGVRNGRTRAVILIPEN